MSIKQYNIALITSAAGINGAQSKWISSQINWTLKALGPGASVNVLVTGMSTSKKSGYGLHASVANKRFPAGTSVQLLPGGGPMPRAASAQMRALQVERADEVWCLPCFGQSGRLSKTRPAMSFWLGIAGRRANTYKWVPPWIGVQESYSKPTKELPWVVKASPY
jgi:hypothetical protein